MAQQKKPLLQIVKTLKTKQNLNLQIDMSWKWFHLKKKIVQ